MNATNETEVSEIEQLLPWHAAGTLGHRDTQRVEAALAEDSDLARRYELVREELAQTIHLNETLGAPSARAMAALFAKIDAEPARRARVSFNPGARIAEFFASRSPRTLAWSAIAAAVAIVLQAGVLTGVMVHNKNPNGFVTASAPSNVSHDGTFALIRFQPQASAADITRFLEINKLSIADGPAAGGLYRVRIAAAKLPKPDAVRIVRTLQADKVVGLILITD